MRSLLGRFHRPMSRGLVNDMLTMNNLGDGSTLSLDFTTGVLDPRLTFTRSSTATFVNSSGYVEYAGANLFANSNFAGTSIPTSWAASASWDGTIPSAGTRRVTTSGTAEQKWITYLVPVSPGIKYSVSVYVSEVSGQHYANTITPTGAAVVDAMYLNGVSVGLYATAMPGLVTVVFSNTSGTTNNIRIGIGATGSGVANAVCEFSLPRAVPGNFASPAYIENTTTSSYHAPRFDYSPTNIGEPRGLLIEGTGINLTTYSEDFANAAWTKSGIAQTPASGTSPDNNNTATLIAENAGSFIKHSLERSVSVTAGSIYTFSVFLKEASSNSRRYACVQVADGQAVAARNTVVFDLQTGTVTANGVNNGTAGAPTDVAHSITAHRDGWYRVTVTMKYVSSPCYPTVMLSDISTLAGGSNQPFYTATVPYKGLLVYGAQLELGSGASSYIPTGASQVTRNPDICYIPISSIGFSTSGGTFFTSFYRAEANLGLNQAGSAINTDYADTRWLGIGSGYGSTTFGFGAWNGALNKTGAGVFGLNKAAGSYASWVTSTTGAFTVNGATAVTGTLSNLGTTPNYLMIGSASQTSPYNGVGLRDFLNNSIRSIKYFPTAFTAAELQALTAP